MSSFFTAFVSPPSPASDRLTAGPEWLNCLLPRRTEWTAFTRRERQILVNLLIGVVLLCVFLATQSIERLREFQDHGRSVTARITGTSVNEGRHRNYYQHFEYLAEDRYRSGWRSVSSLEYTATRVGDTLTITYLPYQPAEFLIGPVDKNRVDGHRIYWVYITAFWAMVFGSLVLWSEVGFRQQRDLLREGIAVTARVTDVQSATSGNATAFFLNYRFETPDGVGHVGRQALNQEMYRYYQNHPDDRAITVLYDKQNPRHSLPYAYLTLAELRGNA